MKAQGHHGDIISAFHHYEPVLNCVLDRDSLVSVVNCGAIHYFKNSPNPDLYVCERVFISTNTNTESNSFRNGLFNYIRAES